MMLTFFGLVMMGLLFLMGNDVIATNSVIAQQNEFLIPAGSLAQSVIEEAKMKAFDANTVSGTVSDPTGLSYTLGPDRLSETLTLPDVASANGGTFGSTNSFDDIDDYNGYTRTVNTPRCEGFLVSVSVSYASETYPDSLKALPTFCKVMTVTVTSPYLQEPVTMQCAFTY